MSVNRILSRDQKCESHAEKPQHPALQKEGQGSQSTDPLHKFKATRNVWNLSRKKAREYGKDKQEIKEKRLHRTSVEEKERRLRV